MLYTHSFDKSVINKGTQPGQADNFWPIINILTQLNSTLIV